MAFTNTKSGGWRTIRQDVDLVHKNVEISPTDVRDSRNKHWDIAWYRQQFHQQVNSLAVFCHNSSIWTVESSWVVSDHTWNHHLRWCQWGLVQKPWRSPLPGCWKESASCPSPLQYVFGGQKNCCVTSNYQPIWHCLTPSDILTQTYIWSYMKLSYNIIFHVCVYIYIWKFPEIGVPPVIIHFNEMFHYKPL